MDGPLEGAALQAVDETREDGAVSDATWAALATQLDERGLIELLMLIAHYMMFTTVLRSLRIQPEPARVLAGRWYAADPRPEGRGRGLTP